MENLKLKDIIDKAYKRELIIPDFQRGFKWKPEDVRKLLESIALDYPIGAVLLWETMHQELGYRTVDSISVVDDDSDISPENDNDVNNGKYSYILDGQQRLTSIYKIFPKQLQKSESEEKIKSNKNIFRFYFDLNKLKYPIIKDSGDINKSNKNHYDFGDEDIAESCQIYTFDKIRKEISKSLHKYSLSNTPQSPENTIIESTFLELRYLPLTIDFLEGSDKMLDKIINTSIDSIFDEFGANVQRETVRDIFSNWKDNFKRKIQTKITQKTVPAIKIEGKDYNALSRIFETINSTGQALTTFDLLVAKMSLWRLPITNRKVGLRDIIKEKISKENLERFDDIENLGGTCCQQLPRVIGLKVDIDKERSLKKSDILGIPQKKLTDVAEQTCESINESLSFLRKTLGVYNEKYLPFKDAITLASSVSSFYDTKEASLFEAYYWLVVFTEDLEKDSNSTTKRLYNEWLDYKTERKDSNQIVKNIEIDFPQFDNLIEVDNKSSILYRAILSFIFSRSKTDWFDDNVQNAERLEDHHIFPKRSISKNLNIQGKKVDTVLNRVLISTESNKKTGDKSPNTYLEKFNRLDEFAIPLSFKENPIPNDIQIYESFLEDRYNLIKKMVIERVKICLLNSK